MTDEKPTQKSSLHVNACVQVADVYRCCSPSTLWKAGMGGIEPYHQVLLLDLRSLGFMLSLHMESCVWRVNVILQVSSSFLAPSFTPVCREHICWLQSFVTHSTLYNLLHWIMSLTPSVLYKIAHVICVLTHKSICLTVTVSVKCCFPLCAGNSFLLHTSEFLSCC